MLADFGQIHNSNFQVSLPLEGMPLVNNLSDPRSKKADSLAEWDHTIKGMEAADPNTITVEDIKVYAHPDRQSQWLRTAEFDKCLYVEEIFEDAPTCAEPSVWGRLAAGGWIVILAKAAGDQGFIRARPYSACVLPWNQECQWRLSAYPRIRIAGFNIPYIASGSAS